MATKTFEFYLGDLTPECQARLIDFLGGENGNYDSFPFATLEIEDEDESEDDVPDLEDDELPPPTAKEKMVVFRCRHCIDDLKEYNPYINEKGEGIPLANVICIEVPDEICENTTFELTPILLNKERYYFDRGIPDKELEILLDRAIRNARKRGFDIILREWEGYYEREYGTAIATTLEDFVKENPEDVVDYFEDGEHPDGYAKMLIAHLSNSYGKGGCAELVAENDDEGFCFYHSDREDEYIDSDLFEFIISESAGNSSPIVALVGPEFATVLIQDLGNGEPTQNEERTSRYFAIAKDRSVHEGRECKVALVERTEGYGQDKDYYELHLINDIDMSACKLFFTDHLSEQELMGQLGTILTGIENGNLPQIKESEDA